MSIELFEDYDLALGPPRVVRRWTPEWNDPFAWVDLLVDAPRQVTENARVAKQRAVRVSIYSTGIIALMEASAKLFPTQRVDLLFDVERRIVGLRPGTSADTAFALRQGRFIDAQEFVTHYRIPWRSMRFPAFMQDGVLCFDVSVEGEPIHRGRPAR